MEIEGYFILTASDGQDALFISRQYPGPIHLLLSDIKMPQLNGLELSEHILKERSEIKILLMTGDTEHVGRMPVLRKPVLPNELRDKVRQIVDRAVLFPT